MISNLYLGEKVKLLIKIFLVFLFTILSSSELRAQDIALLAKKLNLYGGSKATVQWERVFSSKRHLIRYGLDSLDEKTRNELKLYLIQHSADSQQPTVPGL